MRNVFFFLFISILIASLSYGQNQRKVLVEIFTNSHCPLCPPAHKSLSAFEYSDTSAEHVSFIFYHMPFPYSDDPLYQANTSDPSARNSYYGPYSSTPQAFFDGKGEPNSYNTWGTMLDGLVKNSSPLTISLSGTTGNDKINLKTVITRNGNISQTDLVIHYIVVENIHYAGRNGISRHENVMRKMLPSPAGEAFTINDNEMKEVNNAIDLNSAWNTDSLKVVVFVQSQSSKVVYQSETIKYSDLGTATDVKNNNHVPQTYSLEQNFPNPFNPSTRIRYNIPEQSRVKINIYNILGKEVAELANDIQSSGDYNIKWDASNLSSGFYFLTIEAISLQSKNKFIKTIKMILLK